MVNNKRVTKITQALNTMNKDDVYSMMLFTLYKMKDIPDYLTLSELAYILDGDNLTKFLRYFGGTTITVPTLKDLRLVLQALKLYQYVEVEKDDFEDALRVVSGKEFDVEEIKSLYAKIAEVMSNYEFGKDE